MREVLEAIWQDGRVRCPSHKVWWNDTFGYSETCALFWAKGSKL